MSSAQATYSPDHAEADASSRAGAADLAAMRDADVARLEKMQDMAESFCTWLHTLGAEQMESGGDEAVARVRELSNSFNKAARAARLTVTLKHEVAGLRPLRNARAAVPANQNAPALQPALRAYRSDLDPADWTDEEKAEWGPDLTAGEDYLDRLIVALKQDIDEAGLLDQAQIDLVNGATMLNSIPPLIPHPNMDRVLADFALARLRDGIPQHLIYPLPGADPPE
jgi:hypothetical protein